MKLWIKWLGVNRRDRFSFFPADAKVFSRRGVRCERDDLLVVNSLCGAEYRNSFYRGGFKCFGDHLFCKAHWRMKVGISYKAAGLFICPATITYHVWDQIVSFGQGHDKVVALNLAS